MLNVKFKEENSSRQTPWAARAHAAQLDAENVNNFTLAQITAAHDLLNQVKLAYTDSRVFLNYRKKFISVKIDHPTRANRWSEAAEIVDAFAAERDYEKEIKDSSIIYHVK